MYTEVLLQCGVSSGVMQPMPLEGKKAFCMENPSQINELKDGGHFSEKVTPAGGFSSLSSERKD